MPVSEDSKHFGQAGLPQNANVICRPLVGERPKVFFLRERADLLFSPAFFHDWYLAIFAAFNARFFCNLFNLDVALLVLLMALMFLV
jgi:hypothetical protein